jgi:hypothetical protein
MIEVRGALQNRRASVAACTVFRPVWTAAQLGHVAYTWEMNAQHASTSMRRGIMRLHSCRDTPPAGRAARLKRLTNRGRLDALFLGRCGDPDQRPQLWEKAEVG